MSLPAAPLTCAPAGSLLELQVMTFADPFPVLPGEPSIVVSNPPYIPQSLREGLDANVRDHDPGLALFVPDERPFVFYEAIAILAAQSDTVQAVYFETHAVNMQDMREVLSQIWKGSIEVKKDLSGKERFLKLFD